jgi:hypothetical protein
MKATKDADQWYKKWSTWAGVLSALSAIQELLPLWEGIIPDGYFLIASAALATAIPLLTSIKQANIRE